MKGCYTIIGLAVCNLATWPVTAVTHAENTDLQEALAEVRDVKAEVHSRQSSVLGELASPEEMAAHQMRCRPAPVPKAGGKRELDFDADTVQRAKKTDPAKLAKANPRFGYTVLPLGITGAYVKEAQKNLGWLVVQVLDDSPAADRLQVSDVIIGANGRLFTDKVDPRPEMGNALCESQSPELGGILTLHLVRDKKPLNVNLDLGSTLGFSETWPYDCEKSRQVRRAALKHVIESHPWDRRDFWTPAFLMASGDDAALELARRHLLADLQEKYPEGRGGSAWNTSYELINLCEYYLLTGDSFVLPAIRHEAENIAWAQFRSGSWSHGGGGERGARGPGENAGGYGEINCAGLGAFIGLCLARQCGLEPFEHTLPRSVRFFGKFCGVNFPYGLGKPGGRAGRMDNGMNSMAAIGFQLLGEEEMADRWARTVCYMWMGRDRGHAESIFSSVWGPVGAALAPKVEFHAFMNNMKWYYELGRARDGRLVHMRGGRWVDANMTAAVGLFLYLPEKRLQILGGDSVFAQVPPKGLEAAAQLYKDKQWSELTGFLESFLARRPESDAHKDYAEKLLAAYKRMEQHAAATVKIIGQSVAAGQHATAQVQLDLLGRMLGEERPEAARLRGKLGAGTLKNAGRPRAEPLVDTKELVKSLKLGQKGIDGGFACSPAYIAEVQKVGFDGMEPEQIARFFNAPNGTHLAGASQALVAMGERVIPLMKRLVKDEHPGVRAAALGVLSDLHVSDSGEYRSEAPPELKPLIALVQPYVHDEHPMVRNAAAGLLINLKVLNEDMIGMLREMAKLEDAKIDLVVRHGIKDPKLRAELCMELIKTCNRTRCTTPAKYKPINWAVGDHIEECAPYVRVAIDTLNNPAVMTLYGFFSQSPRERSMQLLFHYHDDPLVLEHLPEILAYPVHKQPPFDKWNVKTVEYPHRIIVKLGPKTLPVLEKFYRDQRALYERIRSGKEEMPIWWSDTATEYLESWIAEMQVTEQVVRSMHGLVPLEKGVPALCEIYLSNRPWGEWEREQIREHLSKLGTKAVPFMREATGAGPGTPRAALNEKIAKARDALGEPKLHWREVDRRKAALDALLDDAKRYEELEKLTRGSS